MSAAETFRDHDRAPTPATVAHAARRRDAEDAHLTRWQMAVIERLALSEGQPVEVHALRSLLGGGTSGSSERSRTAMLGRMLRWLIKAGVVRMDPCPRCPACQQCGSVTATDLPAVRRMATWAARGAP